ncbi:MAG: lipoprotein insertase outer membrane protein LolB [Pseudomonadota bacterium]|nr:lipoprotein insertase outer membrane protein LolB [Pseudomonadota bacterium]
MKTWIFILTVNMSGCALIPPSPPPPASPATHALWQTHQAQLRTLTAWRLNGRIAITTEQDNWTAHVHWQQHEQEYRLRFNAPLGQGALLLEGNEQQVMMHTAEQKTYIAENPDALILKTLNLAIPITGLHFWIRGLPKPKQLPSAYRLYEHGYLYSLQQDGWHIEYSRYIPNNTIELPSKIFLDNGQFKVKIVISSWDIRESQLSKPLQVWNKRAVPIQGGDIN